jgi:predicted RNase H-like HicB family nuclease
MKLAYPALFRPCKEGGYTVIFPDLPGCITEGDSLAEAIIMAVDAASGWVLDELEDGKPAPAPSSLDKIFPDKSKNEFVNHIAIDLHDFANQHGVIQAIQKWNDLQPVAQ